MKIRINVISGPSAGRFFDVETGQTVMVGRGDKSQAQVADPSVSRIHFQIGCDGESVTLADQGSSSGTFVDGKQVQNALVPIGSVIQAGDTRFRVEDLDRPTEATISPQNKDATANAKPLVELAGDTLGNYQLIEIIGKANSGVVFKATDTEKGTTVAVKVLTPQYTSDDEQRMRFVRAMKTMLPVKSDRIINLVNAGKTGPYCWAAMDYIEGENLAQLIDRIGIEGMLDWRKVWRVAVDVGRALMTGYEHKIIHRNVTPNNIMRRKSDEACLLGDFMLAKALEGTLAKQVTQPGQILGELPYLAPERTRGDADVDTRSDMYGLGATCYALLTGRPPVSGGGLTEIIANVRNENPEPPKKYQLSVNDLFSDIVMSMIAKDPVDRPQTPSDLIADLVRIGKFNNLDPGF
ncbi:MAG: FHA domain-containing serine/threonine-protein kinase [Planctomycetota bacterium]